MTGAGFSNSIYDYSWMVSEIIRQQVYDQYLRGCVICGRHPEGWSHYREQDEPSIHHIDGDDSNEKLENLVPVCQSCHKGIHRLDEPPYRFYHRQLPFADRNSINQHTSNVYDGTALSLKEAIKRHGQETGEPKSVRYEEYEEWNFDEEEFPTYYHGNP